MASSQLKPSFVCVEAPTGIHIIQAITREIIPLHLILANLILLRMITYHHFQAMLTKVLAVIQQSIEIITFPIHETFNQGSGTRRRCRIIRYAQDSLRMTLVLVHVGTRHSSLQPINNIIINRKCPRKILVTIIHRLRNQPCDEVAIVSLSVFAILIMFGIIGLIFN